MLKATRRIQRITQLQHNKIQSLKQSDLSTDQITVNHKKKYFGDNGKSWKILESPVILLKFWKVLEKSWNFFVVKQSKREISK